MKSLKLTIICLLLISHVGNTQTEEHTIKDFLYSTKLHPDSTFRDDITEFKCPGTINIDSNSIMISVHCESFDDTINLVVQDVVQWKDERGYISAYGGFESGTNSIYDSTYNAFFARNDSGVPTSLTLDCGFVNYEDKYVPMQRIIYFIEEAEKRKIVEHIDK